MLICESPALVRKINRPQVSKDEPVIFKMKSSNSCKDQMPSIPQREERRRISDLRQKDCSLAVHILGGGSSHDDDEGIDEPGFKSAHYRDFTGVGAHCLLVSQPRQSP